METKLAKALVIISVWALAMGTLLWVKSMIKDQPQGRPSMYNQQVPADFHPAGLLKEVTK